MRLTVTIVLFSFVAGAVVRSLWLMWSIANGNGWSSFWVMNGWQLDVVCFLLASLYLLVDDRWPAKGDVPGRRVTAAPPAAPRRSTASSRTDDDGS